MGIKLCQLTEEEKIIIAENLLQKIKEISDKPNLNKNYEEIKILWDKLELLIGEVKIQDKNKKDWDTIYEFYDPFKKVYIHEYNKILIKKLEEKIKMQFKK